VNLKECNILTVIRE